MWKRYKMAKQNSTYTDREINFHFDTINEKLDSILVQTTKTNGRVTKCEADLITGKTSARIANWAFGLTVPLIISMAIWIFFNQIQDIRHEINQHNEDYKNLLNNLK